MYARNIASGITRSFGIFLVAWIMISTHFVPPASASSKVSLGIEITRVATGRDLIVLRGASLDIGPAGTFSITANLVRTPCPGRYRFRVEKEVQETGSSSSVTSTIVFSPTSPSAESIRCGVPLPPRPGTGDVVIAGGESEPFKLDSSRGGTGNFRGTLDLGAQAGCGEPLVFSADFDLRRWHRSFTYRLRVLSVVATNEGVTYPVCE